MQTRIDATPDAQELWEGIAGHFDSLTQVLAEFIDNAIANFDGNNVEMRQIAVRLEEEGSTRVRVSIEDTGTGIAQLATALRLGDKSAQDSPLSEHGFGVKHALATADPTNDTWRVATRTHDEFEAGRYRLVSAPYRFQMDVEEPSAGESPWPGRFNGPGTFVSFVCSRQLFDAISRGIPGNPGFGRTIDYLVEDVGFVYSDIISAGAASISINDGSRNRQVGAVKPDWVDFYEPGQGEVERDLGNGKVKIKYEFGEIRESNYVRYYRRNMSSSGAEIRLNGRLISYNLFPEIWRRERHNSYNHFTARINIVTDLRAARPKTRSSKNGFHEGDPLLESLFEWIRTQIDPPQRLTRHVGEDDLVRKLAERYEQLLGAADKRVTREHEVFQSHGHSPRVDLFVFDGAKRIVFEAKKDTANVQDLYQLVMYWDGMVSDGIRPDEGVLVASSFSAGIDDVIERFSQMSDAEGNPYTLVKKSWRDLGIEYPPEH